MSAVQRLMEFRVVWCECPHVQHTPRVVFVDALNSADARQLARNYIERRYGIGWFTISECKEAPTMPAGRVREEG